MQASIGNKSRSVNYPLLSLPAIALALAVTGCGNDERASEDSIAAEQAEQQATSAVVADVLDENADTPTQSTSGFSSRYTEAAPENCTTLGRETEEGNYVRQRCPGVGDFPLIVEEGDGRMFVHAGNKPDNNETMGPFNTLSPRVEWRMHGGEPIATVHRLMVATPESARDGDTQLFVSKIGKDDAPGCVMAKIAGSYPDANAKAREVADKAASFRCGRDAQQGFGDVIR